MDRLFDALRPFIRAVVRYAPLVLLVAVGLSVLGVYLARGLSIDTDIANLIPESYDSVQALEKLKATVGGESGVAVGIVSPSFEANTRFAEALIPRALALTGEGRDEPYLARAEYTREVEFLKDNALYFATDDELDKVEAFLDEKKREATEAANPFAFDLDIEEEDETADSLAQDLEAVYSRLVGTRYPVSADSTALVVQFFPSGSESNIGFIERLYDDLDELVDEMEPARYHPEMEVVLAGRLYRRLVEVKTIENDVAASFGAGVTAVLLLVTFYFFYKSYHARAGTRFDGGVLARELARLPVLALLIGLPLVMSLTWTGGLAYVLFGQLNLLTSTLGLVLFGLGIDFGIHVFGRYAEERAEGHAVIDAAETTFASTGQAVATGALTTAGALYVLTFADFKGFSEFGALAGTGVLFALVAMTVVLPALAGRLRAHGLLRLEAQPAFGRACRAPAPKAEEQPARYPAARPLVLAGLVLVVLAVAFLPRVGFEYDFGALEPEYTEYNERRDVVERVFESGGDKRNPAYVVVDSPQEAEKVARTVRAHAAADTTSPTILDVDTLQDRFPLADSAQARKLDRIATLRAELDNPALEDSDDPDVQRLRRAAQTRAPISLDEVPAFLKKKFTTKRGELGNFVMIYPSVGLSDGRNSIAFAKDVGTIRTPDGAVYHAGSTSLVAADMLMLMRAEAPYMVGGSLLLVVVLMLLNFRSVTWAALATVPLAVGLLWMLLLMELFGLKLNFYNLVVLPAMLGIGNDDGVHFVHRFREEGRGSIWRVLRSTGEHMLMATLTTMIGFAGLLLSFHPGLFSIGRLAVVGLSATTVAALVFLPALLQWLEDADAIPFDADAEAHGNAAATPPPTRVRVRVCGLRGRGRLGGSVVGCGDCLVSRLESEREQVSDGSAREEFSNRA